MDDETWASRLVKGGAVCGGYLGRVWDVLYGLLYGSKESVVHTLVFSVSPLADPGADPGTVPRDAVARRRGAAPRAVPEPVAPMRRFGLGTTSETHEQTGVTANPRHCDGTVTTVPAEPPAQQYISDDDSEQRHRQWWKNCLR